MTDRLTEICAAKRDHVAIRKREVTTTALDAAISAQSPPRGFRAALDVMAASGFALIAEVKKASPSKGLIRNNFDPAIHAQDYAVAGAACLSVLTDQPYFLGADEYLIAARNACAVPCLRKDFMVDPWQVAESRALGADAILIIMAAVDDSLAHALEAEALRFGMDVLVEVHDEAELERALRLRTQLIGINNRDLRSFTTDLSQTERLAALVPDDVLLVSESGINSHADCLRLAEHGVRAFLVGEALMRQDDLVAATRQLLTGA